MWTKWDLIYEMEERNYEEESIEDFLEGVKINRLGIISNNEWNRVMKLLEEYDEILLDEPAFETPAGLYQNKKIVSIMACKEDLRLAKRRGNKMYCK